MHITPLVKQDFFVFAHDDKLSNVLSKLRSQDKRAGLIFENKRYLGLIERKRLLKTNLDLGQTKVSHALRRTRILSEKDDLYTAARALYEDDVDYLPVGEGKRVVGVIYALDVVRMLCKQDDFGKRTVKQIKLNKPRRVQRDERLVKVIDIMNENRVDHVPVFEGNKLSGIISFRDVIRKYLGWSPRRDLSARFNALLRSKAATPNVRKISDLPVSNFSTNQGLVKIRESATLRQVCKLMDEHNIRNVIVTGESRYKGLVGVRSLLALATTLRETKRYTTRYVGLSKVRLTEHQKTRLTQIVESQAEKLQRRISDNFGLTLHVKQLRRSGKQSTFEVHLKVNAAQYHFGAKKEDWDLEKAVRKCFNVLDSIEKRK